MSCFKQVLLSVATVAESKSKATESTSCSLSQIRLSLANELAISSESASIVPRSHQQASSSDASHTSSITLAQTRTSSAPLASTSQAHEQSYLTMLQYYLSSPRLLFTNDPLSTSDVL